MIPSRLQFNHFHNKMCTMQQHSALSTSHYTPRIKKLSVNRATNQTILAHKRQMNAKRVHKTPLQCKLQPPIVYAMHIPTPKGQSRHRDTHLSNIIHNITWRDDPTHHWTLNEQGLWDTDHAHSAPVQPPHKPPENAISDRKGSPLDGTPIPPSKGWGAHLNHIKTLPDGKIELASVQIPYKVTRVRTRMSQASNPSYTNMKILAHTPSGESKPPK